MDYHNNYVPPVILRIPFSSHYSHSPCPLLTRLLRLFQTPEPKHPLYKHGPLWLAMMNTEIYIGTHWQWLVRDIHIHTLFQERMDVCPW